MNEYDFIVVGTGAGGACVASRLSEAPKARVLALEAGKPREELPQEIATHVDTPALWYRLLGSQVDWGYHTVPQRALNGRSIFEPRGKLPGGSSNFYIMMHVRGHPSDYDNWAYNGCPGWGYQDLLPYFQRLEDQEDATSPWAGKNGALHCANARLHCPNPTSAAFIQACVEKGYPATEDFNGEHMEGAGWHHINVKDGKRHSVWNGYLQPAMARSNFTLQTNSSATRLIFEGSRCTGVEYVRDGKTERVRARYEVIVAGGAIESPKLLLLSGIGDPEELRRFGIESVAALPGVGQNFHNHVLTGVIQECAQPVPPPNQNLSEAAMFCKSEPGWVGPDLQFSFVHVPFNIIIGQGHPNSISILPGLVRPLSRGSIRLGSADPMAPPLIDPNYLGAKSDFDRLVQAVELSRDLFSARAFAPWVKEELMPGPGIRSKEQVRDFVRNCADSFHHQAGSCKMGSDEMAVVDPQLRVYGVEGLRVADASVMPQVPSGNCHAGIVMIGEKCADLLKQTHGIA